jgi:hypothetical protein
MIEILGFKYYTKRASVLTLAPTYADMHKKFSKYFLKKI